MSFEPDTNDIRVRQLGEEIKKIREEQFAKAFPIGLGGGSSPVGGDAVTGGSSTGTFAWLPNMVRVTRDTGVVERLAYKDKNVNKDFFIGDIVDGVTSGASGEIGDIDITGTNTGFLIFVPGTTSGTFVDNEFLNATTDGNNVARADLTLANPVGRGHLNAGSASIIAEATSSPAEIHFIDTAQQNGQLALMRAQNGQTIRIRRAVTNDGNTGNIDLDLSFDITENALVLFQFQAQSNVTPDGGWVPLITNVSSAVGGGAGGGINFPILYPQTNLGSVGLQTVALDLNNPNGHYQIMTLTGDISLAFINETSIGVGFKFYAVLAQDAVGGHKLISVPSSVKNGSSLVTQLDPTPLTQTLFQFTTADGGTTYHAQVVSPASGGQNQTPWLSNIDASTFDLFNADKIIFFGAGGFSFPVDASLQAISTSGTGLQFNVGIAQTYRFFRGGVDALQIGNPSTGNSDTLFFDNTLLDVGAIFFTDSASFTGAIFSNPSFAELTYTTGGVGSHHSFFANNIGGNASFEIREFVNKSNINFDMVTNNILNVDQILFHDLQGFNNATDHGERRLTGGDAGISMNLPINSPFPNAFTIWFEEDTLDRSNPYYQFKRDALIMGTGVGDCTRAPVVTGAIQYQLCRGGGIFDFGTRTSLRSATVSSVPATEQLLELVAGATKKVEFTNTEDGPAGVGGGMKMFTDLNMQTHNINNIDVATWEPDVGTGIAGLGNNAYGIVADDTESLQLGTVPNGVNRPLFLFHAPRDQVVTTNDPAFAWGKMHIVFATLDEGEFHLFANETNVKPVVIGDGGFRYGLSYQPVDNPFIDGESRLINNSGSLDVVYRTGGNLVNLSDLTAGAGNLDIDNDLGDVSGPLFIDWNVSNFHRMRLVGDVTIIMVGLPTSPDWQEITVEFLQDPTGGHSVTFLDIFRNTPVPVIREGANRYTIVKFYSYRDVFDNILTWQPEYLTDVEEAQGSINQGMIHVKLNTDQQTDLGVGNHIEWRTILFTNNMTVSSGAGQSAGIFSGFKTSRTYECTASLGVDKTAVGEGAITYQWFDIAQSQFIGTQGTAQDPSEDNPYQPTAKAFFQAFDTSDTVELRITSQTGNPIDTIYSGFPQIGTAQTPESFAEIKDCGQTQSQFIASQEELINEDTIILPQNPPFIFSSKSTIYTQYQRRNPYSNVSGTIVDAEVIIPFQAGGGSIFATTLSEFALVNFTGQFRAGTFGFLTRTRMDIAENTLNKAINVNFFKNGVQIGTILTIGAGQTGSAVSTGNVRIVAGDKWSYSFQTTDGLIASGFMTWALSTDIEWGVV